MALLDGGEPESSTRPHTRANQAPRAAGAPESCRLRGARPPLSEGGEAGLRVRSCFPHSAHPASARPCQDTGASPQAFRAWRAEMPGRGARVTRPQGMLGPAGDAARARNRRAPGDGGERFLVGGRLASSRPLTSTQVHLPGSGRQAARESRLPRGAKQGQAGTDGTRTPAQHWSGPGFFPSGRDLRAQRHGKGNEPQRAEPPAANCTAPRGRTSRTDSSAQQRNPQCSSQCGPRPAQAPRSGQRRDGSHCPAPPVTASQTQPQRGVPALWLQEVPPSSRPRDTCTPPRTAAPSPVARTRN